MKANELLEETLKLVESKSIREWAVTDHNKPLWLEICKEAVKNKKANPETMAAYMVCVAIGA